MEYAAEYRDPTEAYQDEYEFEADHTSILESLWGAETDEDLINLSDTQLDALEKLLGLSRGLSRR